MFQRGMPQATRSALPSVRRWYSEQAKSEQAKSEQTKAEEAQAKSDEEVAEAVEQAASEASKESAEVMDLLKKKDEEIVDLMSRLRYAQADFANLQRITKIEKQKAQTYATANLAKSLLTTLDNLHMALHSIPESALDPSQAASGSGKKTGPEFFTPSSHTTLKQLHEGVLLTRNSLLQALKAHGVEPFDAKGEPFDPNYHEALFEVPVGADMEGKVVDVLKNGYKIGDRVLRAAQVGVGRKQE